MITPAMKMPRRFTEETVHQAHEVPTPPATATFRSRLRDAVSEALQATGYFTAVSSNISVRVDGEGRIALTGTVPTYYLKQKAQATAMSVDGVGSVRNELVVV